MGRCKENSERNVMMAMISQGMDVISVSVSHVAIRIKFNVHVMMRIRKRR